MKQKKYSHVRKSNYRPPKNHSPQKHPEKRMREEREDVRRNMPRLMEVCRNAEIPGSIPRLQDGS